MLGYLQTFLVSAFPCLTNRAMVYHNLLLQPNTRDSEGRISPPLSILIHIGNRLISSMIEVLPEAVCV